MAQTLPSLGYVQILVKNVFPLFSNTLAKLDPQKTIASRTFWDVFFQTLTLGIVSTNRHPSSKGFTLPGCRGQVKSDTSLGLMFVFFQPKSSRCSCDRSFLRCMLPLNQRDLLTESFPLIHVQHDGLGASAWTVSGTEISRPFATPSRGVFVHQPRNPS